MAAPTTPAEMRAHIIERLVGATGRSDRVTDAARALFERTAPKIREGLKQALALDLAVELASVEVSRIADARPEGEGHALTVAASPTSADALILSMDADAIALVVSMLFRGDSGIAAAPIRREPSPTEIVVATRVFEEIASALNKSGDRSRISRCGAAGNQRRRTQEAQLSRRPGRSRRDSHSPPRQARAGSCFPCRSECCSWETRRRGNPSNGASASAKK